MLPLAALSHRHALPSTPRHWRSASFPQTLFLNALLVGLGLIKPEYSAVSGGKGNKAKMVALDSAVAADRLPAIYALLLHACQQREKERRRGRAGPGRDGTGRAALRPLDLLVPPLDVLRPLTSDANHAPPRPAQRTLRASHKRRWPASQATPASASAPGSRITPFSSKAHTCRSSTL